MKASLFLVASTAVLAMAGPLNVFGKRALKTVVEVEYVTVTVTEDSAPTAGVFFAGNRGSRRPRPFRSTTTSVTPTPTPETTVAPAPEPTTAVPVEVAAPAPEPVVQPEPSPSPEPAAPSPEPKVSTPAPVQQPAANDYATAALNAHNIHRSNHSAPGMTWGDDYAGYALQVAKSCVFKHDRTPGGGGYGQNLATWGSSNGQGLGANTAIAQATTNMWYNGEFNSYLPSYYGQPTPDMSNFSEWGHFSQVVWKASTTLGCATVYCPAGTMNPSLGMWYSVCNYFPAGNVGGGYGANVLPPTGAGTVTA